MIMDCTFLLTRWERKKDAEEQYFPFGKGGGGAPLKDADGKIIGKEESKSIQCIHCSKTKYL